MLCAHYEWHPLAISVSLKSPSLTRKAESASLSAGECITSDLAVLPVKVRRLWGIEGGYANSPIPHFASVQRVDGTSSWAVIARRQKRQCSSDQTQPWGVCRLLIGGPALPD